MDKEYTHEDRKASWDRLHKALLASEKAKKARDKADNSLHNEDPKRLKAVDKHLAAEKEAQDALSHAAHVAKHFKATPVKESVMEKREIIKAILSKDTARIAEAKQAIKELMTARANQFRADSSKFIAKSLFEGTEKDAEYEKHLGQFLHHFRQSLEHKHGTPKYKEHKAGMDTHYQEMRRIKPVKNGKFVEAFELTESEFALIKE
jgi:hypothetical protein